MSDVAIDLYALEALLLPAMARGISVPRVRFELVETGQVFSIDPQRTEVVAEEWIARPDLAIRLNSSVLRRLIRGTNFFVRADEVFEGDGDASALDALAAAVSSAAQERRPIYAR